MPAALRNLDVRFVSLVDRAAVRDPSNPTEPQRFLLWKAEDGPTTTGGHMTPEETAVALEKAQADLTDAQTKLAKAEEDLAKAEKKLNKADKPKDQKIDKAALPPEVREALEKAERESAETRERLEKAEQLAKDERDARLTSEFCEMAKSELPHVGSATDVGPRLKRMSETLSKDDYDAHLTQLRALNAQIETGRLFAEIGKSGDPAPDGAGTSDLDAITRKAEELRKSDPSLSHYEATQQAMRENREAQARYLQNVR